MRGGSVSCGETLARHNKGGRVGTEVEEELSQDIDSQQAVLSKLVVGEAHDDEKNSEDSEAHQLDRLAADGVNSRHGHPVARNSASQDNNEVANGSVVEVFVGGLGARRRVTDGGEDAVFRLATR